MWLGIRHLDNYDHGKRDGILGKIRGTVDKRGQWWTGGRDEIRHFFGWGAIGVLGCGVKIEGTISTFERQSTLFRFFCKLLGTPRPKRNLTNDQRHGDQCTSWP